MEARGKEQGAMKLYGALAGQEYFRLVPNTLTSYSLTVLQSYKSVNLTIHFSQGVKNYWQNGATFVA